MNVTKAGEDDSGATATAEPSHRVALQDQPHTASFLWHQEYRVLVFYMVYHDDR
jgi:hypothetical protein